MRTLKFVSDGTPHGSRVIDAETGEDIAGVESVFLSATVGQPFTHAIISFHRIEVDIIARLTAHEARMTVVPHPQKEEASS